MAKVWFAPTGKVGPQWSLRVVVVAAVRRHKTSRSCIAQHLRLPNDGSADLAAVRCSRMVLIFTHAGNDWPSRLWTFAAR